MNRYPIKKYIAKPASRSVLTNLPRGNTVKVVKKSKKDER